ncbi:hypothetical protein [Pasteuria penetrans]|uniref:hypothetical protein n=1 Tax=Pasteuria penetrans TaxID=86005 RepID=UPI000FBCD91C|nr:hypothetical protein [Pasteuria penetrans]
MKPRNGSGAKGPAHLTGLMQNEDHTGPAVNTIILVDIRCALLIYVGWEEPDKA